MSVARGLTLNGLHISSKLEELEEKNEQTKKRALKLEKALEMAKADLRRAQDEIGVLKDEVEEARLQFL